MATELAKAYVQIIPSAEGIQGRKQMNLRVKVCGNLPEVIPLLEHVCKINQKDVQGSRF